MAGKKSGGLKKKTPTPYLLLAPSIILFTVFSFWPFLKTIVLSFSVTDKKGNFVKWVGLKMYQRVFSSKTFGQIFANTWKFAAMVCLGTFIVAMFLALLSASKERGSRLYEVLYALPMAVASAPASSIFVFLMRKENGFFNSLLGTNIAWIQDPKWALIAVAFVTVWLGIGSSYIFLLVGFRNVPEELIESAILDGAGPVRRAFSILIPLASPQIFFVVFLNITASFKAFGQIKLLTSGGPNNATNTLIYSMYENALLNQRFETACVYAMILFVVIFGVTRIQNFFENRTVYY
ncbi:MAG: sugar ABC transporter permease [Flexilinea sp.]|nr:sugar ABC transporter permease [Flexilinea sp.]